MARRKLDDLCRAMLPPGYDRMCRYGPGIQRFLDENLPPPANGHATLLKIDDSEIVIAAPSPPVANFLRLHAGEIRQQLRETFGLEQAVRFRTVPDALLRVEPPGDRRVPRPASVGSADAIERNARHIDDEGLRESLLALARSLKTEES